MKISMMKNKINEVTIAEPCTQKWDEMDQGEGFKFCKACGKNVSNLLKGVSRKLNLT
jgi:4-hydroxy-3-methylbut-2-en-1-yl diphosphate synthase IspG/GcpE